MTRPAETFLLPGLDDLAHQAVRSAAAHVTAPTLVDATAGNGYDTEFLASFTGRGGTVYAFDVQKPALDNTASRLTTVSPGLNIRYVAPESQIQFSPTLPENHQAGKADAILILDSHAHLARYITGPVHAAMFNLGFLPRSNKAVTTTKQSTLAALEALLPLMAADSVISLHLYTGHSSGQEEAEAVLARTEALPRNSWRVLCISQHNKLKNKEHLILIEHRWEKPRHL